MTRSLIVNADDYGRSPGVSRGIRFAHRYGIVTSTSVMTNMPSAGNDLNFAINETPDLDFGIHLTLTSGKPLSDPGEVRSLVDGGGNFWNVKEFIDRIERLSLSEIHREWIAQVNFFLEHTNKRPTHLDSHQYTSYFTREIFQLMLEIADVHKSAIRFFFPLTGNINPFDILPESYHLIQEAFPGLVMEYKIPHSGNFIGSFYEDYATKEHIISLLSDLPDGISEIMCHPGVVDQIILSSSSYNFQRERELAILTDTEVNSTLKQFEVELISFKEFRNFGSGICY